MPLRTGIFDHFGWAVVVTVNGDHSVVDRRRIELVADGLPPAPIHHPGDARTLEEIEALVATVRAAAARAAGVAFDALATSVPGTISSVHLRALPANFPVDVAAQLRPPYEARADAVMYREVLAEAARERGWVVEFYDAKTAETQARTALGTRADDVLTAPRQRLGPPWTREHRAALAATLLADLSDTPNAERG